MKIYIVMKPAKHVWIYEYSSVALFDNSPQAYLAKISHDEGTDEYHEKTKPEMIRTVVSEHGASHEQMAPLAPLGA